MGGGCELCYLELSGRHGAVALAGLVQHPHGTARHSFLTVG